MARLVKERKSEATKLSEEARISENNRLDEVQLVAKEARISEGKKVDAKEQKKEKVSSELKWYSSSNNNIVNNTNLTLPNMVATTGAHNLPQLKFKTTSPYGNDLNYRG